MTLGLYITKKDGRYYIEGFDGTLNIPVTDYHEYKINRLDCQGFPQKNARFFFRYNGKQWTGLCRNVEWNQFSRCRLVP